MDDVRICKSCGKRYVVENVSDCFPGGKEQEEIVCPHCHAHDGVMITSGFVRTRVFEEE